MLELIKNLEFVKGRNLNIFEISNDDEYLLSGDGDEYILSVYPISKYNKISKRLDRLKELNLEFPDAQIYEEIGVLNDNKCYRIDKKIIDNKYNFDDLYAYKKGFEIGTFIKKYHNTFQLKECGRWFKHYGYRINKVLHRYGLGEYKGEFDYIIFDFLENNKYLIRERSCTTIIGMNSIEDIIVDKSGKFRCIEDYKIIRSDSYFDFVIFNYTDIKCPTLLSGIIDGYFSGRVPRAFFKLLAVYTIVENLYEILDADSIDVERLKDKIDKINEIYDKFSTIYPTWYLDVKNKVRGK